MLKYRRMVTIWAFIILAIIGAWWLLGKWLTIPAAVYISYYIYTHWKDLQQTRIQDWINPVKYLSVLYALFMELMFPLHIVEQIILRMYDMECRECVKRGSCKYCSCSMSKVFVPWEKCTNGNWNEMTESKADYQQMREEFPVEILIRYPKEEQFVSQQ